MLISEIGSAPNWLPSTPTLVSLLVSLSDLSLPVPLRYLPDYCVPVLSPLVICEGGGVLLPAAALSPTHPRSCFLSRSF